MSEEPVREVKRGSGNGQPANSDADLTRDLEVLRSGQSSDASVSRRKPRRLGRWLVLLAIVIAAGAWAASQWLLRAPEVVLVAVTPRDVGLPPVILTASGYLEARRQITVSSKTQGKIVSMPVEENQKVRAGDLIAKIENDEQRASLNLAEAEFADASRELERKRRLINQGTLSQAEFDRAETAFQVARARRELARVAFDNTVLRAPISGTIIRKIRDEGEFLTLGVTAEGDPGTAVVTLADLGAIDVALEISETEIRKVEMGGVTLVTPEARPDRRYLADVIELAAMADRQKGVVPVKVRIREPDPVLLPDMTAKVAFLEGEPEGEIEVLPAVPISSVAERDDQSVVFGIEDGRAVAQPIVTKPLDDVFVAIVEGPGEGSYVIETPPQQLMDGDRVQVHTP